MSLGEVGIYARLIGFHTLSRRRHSIITFFGLFLICLYSAVTARIRLRGETFFNINSTVHGYADILSSSISAISVTVTFLANAKNCKHLQRTLDRYVEYRMRKFWIIHAATNAANVAFVLGYRLAFSTPPSLEYVFFHCYETWALSLEALVLHALGDHWTCQYRILNRNALAGKPLEVVGTHVSITKDATDCVKQLELQFMLVTASGFVRLVVLAFYAVEAVATDGRTGVIAQYTRHALLCALVLLVIARAGENLHREASLTAWCLHSVSWSRYHDDVYIRHLTIASLQLRSQPLRLRIWGLLSLDNTLLFTVAGAACTYVVVLLQFATSAGQHAPTQD